MRLDLSEEFINKWFKEKYPDQDVIEFSKQDKCAMYLREEHNLTPQNSSKIKVPSPINKMNEVALGVNKECPECGHLMYNFDLCSQCDLAKAGYKSIWICPDSVGINRGTSDKANAKTYRTYLFSMGVKLLDKPVCENKGIPDGGYY